MTPTTTQMLAAACAAATLLFLIADARGSRAGKWCFKPLASGLFVAVALTTPALHTAPGRWLVAGLVAGALGDVLLIPSDSGPAFLGGLVSFLLGHVAYVVAFAVAGLEARAAALAAALLIPVGAVIGRWLVPRVKAELKIPVLAYMVVITVMVSLAVGQWRAGGPAAWLIAAVAFYLSDLSVARDRFVSPGFGNRAWGVPLYYGAQLVFALSAARNLI